MKDEIEANGTRTVMYPVEEKDTHNPLDSSNERDIRITGITTVGSREQGLTPHPTGVVHFSTGTPIQSACQSLATSNREVPSPREPLGTQYYNRHSHNSIPSSEHRQPLRSLSSPAAMVSPNPRFAQTRAGAVAEALGLGDILVDVPFREEKAQDESEYDETTTSYETIEETLLPLPTLRTVTDSKDVVRARMRAANVALGGESGEFSSESWSSQQEEDDLIKQRERDIRQLTTQQSPLPTSTLDGLRPPSAALRTASSPLEPVTTLRMATTLHRPVKNSFTIDKCTYAMPREKGSTLDNLKKEEAMAPSTRRSTARRSTARRSAARRSTARAHRPSSASSYGKSFRTTRASARAVVAGSDSPPDSPPSLPRPGAMSITGGRASNLEKGQLTPAATQRKEPITPARTHYVGGEDDPTVTTMDETIENQSLSCSSISATNVLSVVPERRLNEDLKPARSGDGSDEEQPMKEVREESIQNDCNWTRKNVIMAVVFATIVVIAAATIAIFVSSRGDSTDASSKTVTRSPTSAPSSETPQTVESFGFQLLRDQLVIEGIVSDPEDLFDRESPQFQALDWLVYENSVPDLGNVTDFIDIESTTWKTLVSRFALAVFFYGLNGPGWITEQPSASFRQFWLHPTKSVCDWSTIISCDDEGNVNRISEEVANNMIGTIPAEINVLPNLQRLLIKNNEIQGIAGSIENLQSMGIINQSRSASFGSFPAYIYKMTNLQELRLLGNGISGKISSEIGKLTSLRIVDLSNNELSGTVPVEFFNSLTNLDSVKLSQNMMEGKILEEGFPKLERLRFFDISENNFSGTIGSSIGNLNRLESIFMNQNNFSGSIPTSVGLLTNLKEWIAIGANIEGSIPSELGSCTDLERLRLDENPSLEGVIPVELTMLQKLENLSLIENSLTGTLPTQFGTMTKLRSLLLERNLLRGTVPTELGLMSSLTDLNLGANSLDGTIPIELGTLSSMITLNLGINFLSGFIPTQLGLLGSLESLLLNQNQLTGSVPVELGSVGRLTTLDLSANNLSGTFPSAVCNLERLSLLSVKGNILLACEQNCRLC